MLVTRRMKICQSLSALSGMSLPFLAVMVLMGVLFTACAHGPRRAAVVSPAAPSTGTAREVVKEPVAGEVLDAGRFGPDGYTALPRVWVHKGARPGTCGRKCRRRRRAARRLAKVGLVVGYLAGRALLENSARIAGSAAKKGRRKGRKGRRTRRSTSRRD